MTSGIWIKRIMGGIIIFLGIVYMIDIVNKVIKAQLDINSVKMAGLVIYMCIALSLGTLLYYTTMNSDESRKKVVKRLVYVLFAFYSFILIGILFYNANRIGAMSQESQLYHVNFVPFFTIKNYLRAFGNNAINNDIFFFNILGNVLLFMPLGMMGLIKFKWLHRFPTYLTCMVVLLLVIEMLQFTTGTGAFDIDDIILNGIGLIVSWLMCQFKWLKNAMGYLQN